MGSVRKKAAQRLGGAAPRREAGDTTRAEVGIGTEGTSPAIGIRATPRGFHFAVASGTRTAPVLDDTGRREIPASYSFPEGLKFLFNEARDLAARHCSCGIAIRVADHSRFSPSDSDRNRLRIEGVIGAAFALAGMNAEFSLFAGIGAA